MANTITMTTREAIRALSVQGYSKRRISRELGVHRNTHCLENFSLQDAPAEGEDHSKCTIPTTGNEALNEPQKASEKKQKHSRRSHCEPYRDLIESKLEEGLNAMRIWRDLVDGHDFKDGYQSVKRYVSKLKDSPPSRVWRMECEPGEEAQIDYGTQMVEIAAKKRKIHRANSPRRVWSFSVKDKPMISS